MTFMEKNTFYWTLLKKACIERQKKKKKTPLVRGLGDSIA